MKALNKSKILNVFKYTMASLVVGSLYLSAHAGTVMDEITITQEAEAQPVIVQTGEQTESEEPTQPVVVQGDGAVVTQDKVEEGPVVIKYDDKGSATQVVAQNDEPSKVSGAVVIQQDDNASKVPGTVVTQEPYKVPATIVVQQQDEASKVPPTSQQVSSTWTLGSVDKDFSYLASQFGNLSEEKQYSCLGRYLRYAGNKRLFNNQYKRVYNMFWNGSKDQSKLIELGAKERGFSEDNVREIIEIGFKRGDFCAVGNELMNDKAVENYVRNFSKDELQAKEVANHDRRNFSCKDEYIWEHVRDRAVKKGVTKGAAVAAIYGGLTGNGPIFVAALGTGLYGLFHKSQSSKVAINYSLMNDSEIPAEHKEYARIYREVAKLMGNQFTADPKQVEQIIAATIAEGFASSDFCQDGRKLLSSSEIRAYTVARIAAQLQGGADDTYKVAGKQVVDQARFADPIDQALDGAQEVEPTSGTGAIDG